MEKGAKLSVKHNIINMLNICISYLVEYIVYFKMLCYVINT